MNKARYFFLLFCSCFVSSASLAGTPWLTPDNIYLRADIQLLSDQQIIKVPVNHWPLNWSDISGDLLSTDILALPPSLRMSYQRVMFYYHQAKRKQSPTTLRVSVASDTPEFQHFGSPQREKYELSSEKSFLFNDVAVGIAVQKVSDPLDGDTVRFDNSYLSYKWNNWNITAGAVPMWWGPGWDSVLTMSNNARPIPGISINRQQALAFDNEWLSWLGPWSFTTFFGQLESERHIPNANLWSSRLSFRPLENLEWGFSRSTQWGGDGRADGLSAFFDIVIPSESENDIQDEKNVNDLASLDFRWNTQLFEHPINVNYQMGFEDYASIIPSKRSYLFGLDTTVFFDNAIYTLFFEGSATYLNTCTCIYKHHIYKSGYIYKQRVIGSTYAFNAQTITFGVIGQLGNDRYFRSTLAYIERNLDNKHRSYADGYQYNYDEIWQLDSSYRFIFADSQWDVGVILRHTKNNLAQENKAEASLSWQYKF